MLVFILPSKAGRACAICRFWFGKNSAVVYNTETKQCAHVECATKDSQ